MLWLNLQRADDALDDETDNEMETDDAAIDEEDDLPDEFFEKDSNEPEKPSRRTEELSEDFSDQMCFRIKIFQKQMKSVIHQRKKMSA